MYVISIDIRAVCFIKRSNPLHADSGILWKPLDITFNAYRLVFDNPMIIQGYLNTFLIVSGGLVLNITLTAFGAYALSRKGLRYRKR